MERKGALLVMPGGVIVPVNKLELLALGPAAVRWRWRGG